MKQRKYVALDVDSANIVAAVFDSQGRLLMQTHLRTEAKVIQEFFKMLTGTVHVTFEEGAQAAWLYELISPLVAEVVVCNPRENKLLKAGNKSDRIDVGKLGRLLRLGELKPVYKGRKSNQGLKHLTHSYDELVADTTRTKNRLKALYRGRGISVRVKGSMGASNESAGWPSWKRRKCVLGPSRSSVNWIIWNNCVAKQKRQCAVRRARIRPTNGLAACPALGAFARPRF